MEIIPTESEAEIHLIFKTQARYLYHFPLEPSNDVKVHLVFPNLPRLLGASRDEVVSPPSDLVPSFTVVFPDQETQSTKRLTVKFSEPLSFNVRGRKTQDGIVISVPLKIPKMKIAQPRQSLDQQPLK